MDKDYEKKNPLGTEPVGKLLSSFAIPSIIAMLVSALYNMVDQYFIGQNVGTYGNGATNVAFPLSTACIAIALMFGIGGASTFNLAVGRGEKDTAGRFIGNAAMCMFVLGLLLCAVVQLNLTGIMYQFGATENNIDYAVEYTRITAIGFPFLILSTGGGHLVRADGAPKMTMICNITGAVINTVLDYIFVAQLGFGMKGAAVATVVGQVVATLIVLWYLVFRMKTVKLKPADFWFNLTPISKVMSLGLAPCFNQLAMMVVQIVMNKSLKYYGEMSSYGSDIPITCVGIISKVSMVFFALIIGISQGLQPIVSFNYGAANYQRVKKALFTAFKVSGIISVFGFLTFEIFPRQIVGAFGEGSDEYFKFATRYFRMFMFFSFINFLQPITSNFFTAIGKPIKGVFLSLTRQIIFFLPLVLILPKFLGIDGIVFAGPLSDFVACTVTILMLRYELSHPEFKKTKALE